MRVGQGDGGIGGSSRHSSTSEERNDGHEKVVVKEVDEAKNESISTRKGVIQGGEDRGSPGA